ncbi:MAG: hypothetical protein AB1427_02750 [Thermodesulfobacteriota bacterium]
MNKRIFYLLVIGLGLSVSIFLAGNALAQSRVIEEQIVLKDPTVSAPKKWAVGASAEFWYVFGPYDSYDNGVKVADGYINSTMPGGNAFIGYDNWTLQFSYRAGDADIKMTDVSGTPTWNEKQDQKEFEVTLRYLIRAWSAKHFVPYLLGGYNSTALDKIYTLETPGWTWTSTGTPVVHYENDYRSWMLGVGAVVPFNQSIGIRGDVRVAFTDAESKNTDTGSEWSDSGIGGVGFLTGYWNIFEGLNFQVGGKFQYLNGGDNVASYGRLGVFAMLGYSYKF